MMNAAAVNHAFTEIETLAAERDQVIYDICCRRAGWAIQWHDARLVKTPPPPEMIPGKNWPEVSRINQARLSEGLIIYQYYPTIADCLREEKARLLKEEVKSHGR